MQCYLHPEGLILPSKIQMFACIQLSMQVNWLFFHYYACKKEYKTMSLECFLVRVNI